MARVLLAHPNNLLRPVLDITLSERNLVMLLSHLYTPDSTCSFPNGNVPEGFDHAVFRVEPDELHYASPTRDGRPPGPIHPIAELVHATVRRVVDRALTDAGARPHTLLQPGTAWRASRLLNVGPLQAPRGDV